MILTVGLLALGLALTVAAGTVLIAIGRLVDILPSQWAREGDEAE
jgi:hypothetical protein